MGSRRVAVGGKPSSTSASMKIGLLRAIDELPHFGLKRIAPAQHHYAGGNLSEGLAPGLRSSPPPHCPPRFPGRRGAPLRASLLSVRSTQNDPGGAPWKSPYFSSSRMLLYQAPPAPPVLTC